MRPYLKLTVLLFAWAFISCQKSPTMHSMNGTFWAHERESTSIENSVTVIHFRDDETMIYGVGNPEDKTAWGFPLSYVATGKNSFRFGFSINLNDEESTLREEFNVISGTGVISKNTLTLTFNENDEEIFKLSSASFSFITFGEEE